MRFSVLENVAHFCHSMSYTLTCLASGAGGYYAPCCALRGGELATAVHRLFWQGGVGVLWVIDYRVLSVYAHSSWVYTLVG